MPDWAQGRWLSIGIDHINTNTFYINQSQIIMKINDNRIVKYDLKFLRTLQNQQHEKSIQIRAKSFEEW